MKTNSLLLFLPLIIVTTFSSTDSSTWVLRKSKNGISVYTRYAEGSSIKEVRVIDTVKSTYSAEVALLLDTKNFTKWVYHCTTYKVLKSINEQEQYYYLLTSVPFPFSNRDVVTDSKISQDSATKTVTINTIATPDFLPVVQGVVRIQHYHSIYTLTRLADGKLQIDYTAFGDPGGDIPDWLINANIVVGPYKTTLEMNKRLPQYQKASFAFIKE